MVICLEPLPAKDQHVDPFIAGFWAWLADRLDDLPELAGLTPRDKAMLAALLRAEPTLWGPH